MKYMLTHRTQSGTRPAVRVNMRPTIKIDVASLIRDDEERPTERRPDFAQRMAGVMNDYPEIK